METRMRHAVHVPNLRDYGDPAVLVSLAVEAEAADWDGFFVWDHILHRRAEPEPVVDPWVTLGACAVRTERIRLGTLITPVARRRPWKLARELATLDVLSGGRAILGVALGAPRHDEFEAFGEEGDDRRRAQRLDEGLDVLAGLLGGERFSHRGEFYALDEMQFLPAPPGRRVPIWVGGNWPNRPPFRRAARWDGVVPEKVGGQLPTPDELREVVAFVREQRVAAGNDAEFDVVAAGFTDGPDDEGAAITRAYAEAGATWWLERFHPSRGSVEDARRRIAAGPARGAEDA
jgi:alkanesulfonate monooxygenase SsuD/methylene tetrahydromethanopterin reductase-like flavin-dependent oxidoreductase (luciferase family)